MAAVALTRLDPFQPATVWDAVEQDDVTTVSVVSDASARQLAEALRAEPERWDLSRLRTVTCATAVPLPRSRRALTELLPTTEVVVPRHRSAQGRTDRFRVVDDVTGLDVEPGSGTVGAARGRRSESRSATSRTRRRRRAHFRTIDGSRFWLSGEHATVDDDGVVRSAAAERR